MRRVRASMRPWPIPARRCKFVNKSLQTPLEEGGRMSQTLTSTRGQRNLPRWFGPVFATVSGIRRGAMEFVLPDGRVFRAEGADPGPTGRVEIRNPDTFGRVVRDGELGFAEAYMDAWWDTPDLQAVLDVALLNNQEMARQFTGAAVVRWLGVKRDWSKPDKSAGTQFAGVDA